MSTKRSAKKLKKKLFPWARCNFERDQITSCRALVWRSKMTRFEVFFHDFFFLMIEKGKLYWRSPWWNASFWWVNGEQIQSSISWFSRCLARAHLSLNFKVHILHWCPQKDLPRNWKKSYSLEQGVTLKEIKSRAAAPWFDGQRWPLLRCISMIFFLKIEKGKLYWRSPRWNASFCWVNGEQI